MKRIGLAIDGSNMFESSRSLDFRVDYEKLLKFYKSMGDVIHAQYFTALPPKHIQHPLRQMVDWLQYNGYSVIQKETHEFVGSDGLPKRKGNMDVEIAVYTMKVLHSITHLVLFSGDGDFRILVEAAQDVGIHVTVVAAMATVADSMRRQPNEFVDLALLKGALTHEAKPKASVEIVRRRISFLNGE